MKKGNYKKYHNISGKEAVRKGFGKDIPAFELLHFGGYKKARLEYLKSILTMEFS